MANKITDKKTKTANASKTKKTATATKTNKGENKYLSIVKQKWLMVLFYYVVFLLGLMQSFIIRKKHKEESIVYCVVSLLGVVTCIILFIALRYKI